MVDSSSLRVLTAAALAARRKEEEEEKEKKQAAKRKEVQAEMQQRAAFAGEKQEEEEEAEEAEASQDLFSSVLSLGSAAAPCQRVSLRGSSCGDSRPLCERFPPFGTTSLLVTRPTGTQQSCSYRVSQ